jgi:hypothetical protein
MDTKFWSENLKTRDHLENLDTDGRMLNHTLKKKDWRKWTELTGPEQELVVVFMVKVINLQIP